MHGFAGQLSVLRGDLTGVEAHPHLELGAGPRAVECIHRLLDRDRAREGAARRDEYGGDPVIERWCLVLPVVRGDLLTDQFGVTAEELVGPAVTDRGSKRG